MLRARGSCGSSVRPLGGEVQVQVVADQFGQRDAVLERDGPGDGVDVHQPSAAGAVLAPLDEDFPEAAVGAGVGGDVEPLAAEGDSGGVTVAPTGHVPLDRYLPHGPSTSGNTICGQLRP